jgi:hypothetical protein
MVISIDNGERLEGADVVLRDAAAVLVSSVRADSTGAFTFPTLSQGTFRLSVPGFSMPLNAVELTKSNSTRCTQPVIFYVGLHSCSAGYVGRKWDYRRFPDGPPPAVSR